MAATKRLFISTDYWNLKSITPENHFKRYKSLVQENFTILPVEGSTTLFLISQDLSDPSKLDSLQINKEGFEDYLLYHEDNTKSCIINEFQKSRIQAGHHEELDPTNEIENRAFAEALQVILDDTRPANTKAATIINIIWPDKTVLRKEGLKHLTQYKRKSPAKNESCPSVFSTTEMQTAFDELKGKSINDKDYTASLAKLADAFNEHYFDAN